MAHSGPHIQLAVGPQRQVHDRIVHRSPDVALVIGHRQQRSQRASALDLQRHAGPVLLQGVAHHGDRSQRPAQRRRGHRQSLVDLTARSVSARVETAVALIWPSLEMARIN